MCSAFKILPYYCSEEEIHAQDFIVMEIMREGKSRQG
jgi:hypothetical protein